MRHKREIDSAIDTPSAYERYRDKYNQPSHMQPGETCDSSPAFDIVGSPCSRCKHPAHWQVECAYCGLDDRIVAMVKVEVTRQLDERLNH